MKRVIFGFIWCVVIYLVACTVAGAIAGGLAGANNPANAAQAGAEAGARFVGENRMWFALGAVVVSVVGTITGFLPGTKTKKDDGEETA